MESSDGDSEPESGGDSSSGGEGTIIGSVTTVDDGRDEVDLGRRRAESRFRERVLVWSDPAARPDGARAIELDVLLSGGGVAARDTSVVWTMPWTTTRVPGGGKCRGCGEGC